MKFWESDFSCEQILSLPFVFFCFFFFSPLLTSKSHYSTSLIQFAVRSFASLNIAFAIAFMSTWGFRRCVFFFFPGWIALHAVLCTVWCGFTVCFMLVLKHLEGQQPPPNSARRANIFFTWHSENEPCWEPGVGIHCCGVPWEVWALLWSAEELFTAQSLSDEFLKIAELVAKKTMQHHSCHKITCFFSCLRTHCKKLLLCKLNVFHWFLHT